jgi:hypothetical protein
MGTHRQTHRRKTARRDTTPQGDTHTLQLLGACFVGYLGSELVHLLVHGLNVVVVPIFA